MSLYSVESNAQQRYGISPYPDVWYNSIDGVRLGVRVIGEEVGAFKEGPHQLDAGVWLGTNLPDQPVSYYFSLIEPIQAISEFAEEGSIQVISSARAGFARHRVQLNKRFQPGFDEYNNANIHIFYSHEKMYAPEYAVFPMLWSSTQTGNEDWKSLIGIELNKNLQTQIARISGTLDFEHNLTESIGHFSTLKVELKQRINPNSFLVLRLRQFIGLNFGDLVAENGLQYTMNTATELVDNEFSRAGGTVPSKWLETGTFQFQGGANLRGYNGHVVQLLTQVKNYPGSSTIPFNEKLWSVNVDVELSNPIDKALDKQPIIGDLMEVRSYLFFDMGKATTSSIVVYGAVNTAEIIPQDLSYTFETDELLMDAGAGLQISFNIPDYLANDRGVFLRYEIPFWLSSPQQGDPNFKYRTLIGVGAIFSF